MSGGLESPDPKLAHDDEQPSDQQSSPERSPSAPPPFASRPEDEPSDQSAGVAAPPTPEPSTAGGAFEDARRQLRAQAEQTREDVNQLLLSENERLRDQLTRAVEGLEQTIQDGARERVDAEIERIRAAADQTAAQVKA